LGPSRTLPGEILDSSRNYKYNHYLENFEWKYSKGEWTATLFDWEKGYKKKVGEHRVLSNIPSVDLDREEKKKEKEKKR
jgi:hypothetical protein